MEALVRLYPWVRLGEEVRIEDFSIIGKPTGRGEPHATVVGPRALIRSHAVIYEGVEIGADFACGHHILVRESTRIGAAVSLGTGSVLEHSVVVEDGVRIHSHCFIPEFSLLKRGCWIGPRVVLTNAKYPGSPGAKARLQGPIVEEEAKIGANATLLPGVRIGRGALVGAGAVVTRDVAAGAVVVGNPARQVKAIGQLPYAERR